MSNDLSGFSVDRKSGAISSQEPIEKLEAPVTKAVSAARENLPENQTNEASGKSADSVDHKVDETVNNAADPKVVKPKRTSLIKNQRPARRLGKSLEELQLSPEEVIVGADKDLAPAEQEGSSVELDQQGTLAPVVEEALDSRQEQQLQTVVDARNKYIENHADVNVVDLTLVS